MSTPFRSSQARTVLEGLVRWLAPMMLSPNALREVIRELNDDARLWADVQQAYGPMPATEPAPKPWPHRCSKAPWRGGHIAGVVGESCSLCGQTREESERSLREYLDSRNVARAEPPVSCAAPGGAAHPFSGWARCTHGVQRWSWDKVADAYWCEACGAYVDPEIAAESFTRIAAAGQVAPRLPEVPKDTRAAMPADEASITECKCGGCSTCHGILTEGTAGLFCERCDAPAVRPDDDDDEPATVGDEDLLEVSVAGGSSTTVTTVRDFCDAESLADREWLVKLIRAMRPGDTFSWGGGSRPMTNVHARAAKVDRGASR